VDGSSAEPSPQTTRGKKAILGAGKIAFLPKKEQNFAAENRLFR